MSEMLCTFNTSNIGVWREREREGGRKRVGGTGETFINMSLGLCNFSNMTVRGYSGGFTIMAKVAGILSNPLNLTIGGIGTLTHSFCYPSFIFYHALTFVILLATYVEPLASNVSKTITRLQQNFPLVPYVQVIPSFFFICSLAYFSSFPIT